MEALTIVVAAGVRRGWRPASRGAPPGALLGVLVGVVGSRSCATSDRALRVVVGALLLVLGLSWLRKAILRASGHKDPHGEERSTPAPSAGSGRGAGRRPAPPGDAGRVCRLVQGGVFEGMEVVLIVVSLGAKPRIAWPRRVPQPRRR